MKTNKNKRIDFKKIKIGIVVGLLLVIFGAGYRTWVLKTQSFPLPETRKEFEPVESNLVSQAEASPEEAKTSYFFLEVDYPSNNLTVDQGSVEVRGRTVIDAEVFVNDKHVYPDQKGSFYTKVELEEGENIILIGAGNEQEDKEIERIVYYEQE